MNIGNLKHQVARVLALLAIAWLAPMAAHAQPVFRSAASASATTVAPIAFRAAGTVASSSAGGNVTPGLPAGTAAGDLLICVIETDDNVAPSMTGWTLLNSDNGGAAGHQASLFRRIATGGDPTTVTQPGGGGGIIARIIGFSGVDPTTPIDTANSFTFAASSTTTAAGAITTVTPNTMLVFTGHMAERCNAITTPAGSAPWASAFLSNLNAGGTRLSIAAFFGLRAALGSQALVTATWSGGGCVAAPNHGAQIALRPAQSGLVIALPPGTLQNDGMIASLAVRPSTVVITPPTGWTLVRRTNQGAGNTNSLAIYSKIAGASEPAQYAWGIDSATTGAVGGIRSFSNVNTTTPIDVENGQVTPFSVSHATPSVTTTVANTMLVTTHSFSSSATWTPPGGMTEAIDLASVAVPNAVGIAMEGNYATQALAAATGVKTAIASNDADTGNAHILALRPGAGINHFAINIGGAAGNTCAPKNIIITAQDAANATVTNYTGTINISTSALHGNWAIVTGAGTLTSGAADSGAASYAFAAADMGVVTLSLSDTHADDTSVSVVDSGIPSTLSTSATINFRGDLFVIVEDPIQVAGRNQAMSATMKTGGGACATATAYTGAKALKAWLTRDPSDPGGAAPTIGAVSLPNAVPGANNLTLTFASGAATFNLSTTDVGKYVLNLRDDTRSFATGADINGSSNALTTRPFALGFTNIKQGALANPGGTAGGGAKFVAAEDVFQATVGGYLWSAADDLNNDGVPDTTSTNVTDNGLTPSFRWATTLSATTPITPAAGSTGALGGSVNITLAGFAGGQATVVDLTYNQVGSMTLSAIATNFLNSGVTVSGASTPVGRFYPDHFALTASALAAACNGFTYMNQAAINFSYTLQAQGKSNGLTSNYSVALGYPVAAVSLVAEDANAGTDLGPRITSTAAVWSAGQYSVSSPSSTFARLATPDGPYDALAFGIRAVDADGAVIANRDMNAATAADCVTAANCDAKQIAGATTRVRFGRLRLQNANGSQLITMPIPIQTQYWNGSGFVTNTLDNCTTVALANIAIGNPQQGLTAAMVSPPTVGGAFTAGIGSLRLRAPGSANRGSVDVSVNLTGGAAGASCTAGMPASTGSNLTHLQGLWCTPPGTYVSDPTARATFGVYRNADKFIYQRENY